jgi:ATP-binding cassette subfamily B protein
MVAAHYGRLVGVTRVREAAAIASVCLTPAQLVEVACRLGFRSRSVQASAGDLYQLHLPAVLQWEGSRWVVLYALAVRYAYIADPESGKKRIPIPELAARLGSGAVEMAPAWGTEKARPLPSYRRRLLCQLAAHKGALAAFIASSLLLNLFGLVVPWITQAILDRVVPQGDLSLLAQLVAVMVSVTAFQIALTVWRRLLLLRMSVSIDRALLGAFSSHLLALPTSFFRRRRAGDLVARFNDGGQVRGLATGSLTRSAIDSAMVLVYFGVMFVYSARLAVVVAGVLVLFVGYTVFISPLVKHLHRRLLEDKAAHEARLIEMVAGIELVKSLAVEGAMRRRWEAAFGRYLASDYRAQMLRQVLECAGGAIKFLCTVALLWYGAVLVVQEQLSSGQLVAFSMYASEALFPIVRLIAVWEEFQEARVAVERMEEVLHEEAEPQSPAAAARLSPHPIEGRVQYEQVHFDYGGPDPAPVLRGVTFEVRPGERVAVVGRSGSGKTTLARLLLGLIRPTRGRVCIDGRDLADLDLTTYRRQLGVVLQDNMLVRGPVWENIALGDDKPDRGRVIEAARLAGAHEFIAAMPCGYDSVVGEMGLTLSGGQRQRLSIARALYRNPRLLIFDEATSALDGAGEKAVQESLNAVLSGRTAVMIAHRLTTIRHADRILVLQDGVIVEEGAHDELLRRRGAYYALVAGQVDQ